jgi:predicted Rossmann fold nucleotide-binding protein DprA/Smf involved in DNA uptake
MRSGRKMFPSSAVFTPPLLREGRPIIYTLARALEGARLPAAVRAAEKKGHALILSFFGATARQTTARTAEERNRHILARAASVLIAHASPGGKTESLAAKAIAMGLPVFTLSSPANANLVGMGATVT